MKHFKAYDEFLDGSAKEGKREFVEMLSDHGPK